MLLPYDIPILIWILLVYDIVIWVSFVFIISWIWILSELILNCYNKYCIMLNKVCLDLNKFSSFFCLKYIFANVHNVFLLQFWSSSYFVFLGNAIFYTTWARRFCIITNYVKQIVFFKEGYILMTYCILISKMK